SRTDICPLQLSIALSEQSSCFLLTRRPPISTPFPYTTLFRSTGPFPVSAHALQCRLHAGWRPGRAVGAMDRPCLWPCGPDQQVRSEEHTSEVQSRGKLVCRLLLEKKKLIRTKIE